MVEETYRIPGAPDLIICQLVWVYGFLQNRLELTANDLLGDLKLNWGGGWLTFVVHKLIAASWGVAGYGYLCKMMAGYPERRRS